MSECHPYLPSPDQTTLSPLSLTDAESSLRGPMDHPWESTMSAVGELRRGMHELVRVLEPDDAMFHLVPNDDLVKVEDKKPASSKEEHLVGVIRSASQTAKRSAGEVIDAVQSIKEGFKSAFQDMEAKMIEIELNKKDLENESGTRITKSIFDHTVVFEALEQQISQDLKESEVLKADFAVRQSKLETEVNRYKARASELERELEQCKDEAASLEQKLDGEKSAQRELQELRDEVVRLEQELKCCQSKSSDLISELRRSRDEVQQLEHELEDRERLLSRSSEFEQELLQAKDEMARLEKELQTERSELKKVTERLVPAKLFSRIEEPLHRLTAYLEEVQRQCPWMSSAIAQSATANELPNPLDLVNEHKVAVEQLTLERNDAESRLQQALTEYSELRETHEKLCEKTKLLESQREVTNAELTKLKRSNAKYHSYLKQLLDPKVAARFAANLSQVTPSSVTPVTRESRMHSLESSAGQNSGSSSSTPSVTSLSSQDSVTKSKVAPDSQSSSCLRSSPTLQPSGFTHPPPTTETQNQASSPSVLSRLGAAASALVAVFTSPNSDKRSNLKSPASLETAESHPTNFPPVSSDSGAFAIPRPPNLAPGAGRRPLGEIPIGGSVSPTGNMGQSSKPVHGLRERRVDIDAVPESTPLENKRAFNLDDESFLHSNPLSESTGKVPPKSQWINEPKAMRFDQPTNFPPASSDSGAFAIPRPPNLAPGAGRRPLGEIPIGGSVSPTGNMGQSSKPVHGLRERRVDIDAVPESTPLENKRAFNLDDESFLHSNPLSESTGKVPPKSQWINEPKAMRFDQPTNFPPVSSDSGAFAIPRPPNLAPGAGRRPLGEIPIGGSVSPTGNMGQSSKPVHGLRERRVDIDAVPESTPLENKRAFNLDDESFLHSNPLSESTGKVPPKSQWINEPKAMRFDQASTKPPALGKLGSFPRSPPSGSAAQKGNNMTTGTTTERTHGPGPTKIARISPAPRSRGNPNANPEECLPS
ncbi:unnamed protein product [Calicophoron daubneyi]|uniref:Uncharacterized protein n=1 Tax=Calicophoron daubneyi TaxID=300641 RepID=A0AAV2TW36_CALDB